MLGTFKSSLTLSKKILETIHDLVKPPLKVAGQRKVMKGKL